MIQIRDRSPDIKRTKGVSELLGKKVYSRKGKEIGEVKDVRLVVSGEEFGGIELDHDGYCLYIGREFIKLDNGRIIAELSLIEDVKGLQVYDNDLKHVGKVKEAIRKDHSYLLVVDRGNGDGKVNIEDQGIERIGSSVFLKCNLSQALRRLDEDSVFCG